MQIQILFTLSNIRNVANHLNCTTFFIPIAPPPHFHVPNSHQLRSALQSQQQKLEHALQVRTRQLLLELQHARLRQQLERVSRALASERDTFKELCPRIVSAHRGMRDERIACVQLARQCVRLGRQCRGAAYT